MESATTGRTVAAAPAHLNSVTARWWSVFDARIGALPVPVYLVLLAVLAAMTLKGELASDLPTGIALVAVGGFTCAEHLRGTREAPSVDSSHRRDLDLRGIHPVHDGVLQADARSGREGSRRL